MYRGSRLLDRTDVIKDSKGIKGTRTGKHGVKLSLFTAGMIVHIPKKSPYFINNELKGKMDKGHLYLYLIGYRYVLNKIDHIQ